MSIVRRQGGGRVLPYREGMRPEGQETMCRWVLLVVEQKKKVKLTYCNNAYGTGCQHKKLSFCLQFRFIRNVILPSWLRNEKHHDGLFLEEMCMSAMLCIAGLSIASILYQVFFSFLIYSLT